MPVEAEVCIVARKWFAVPEAERGKKLEEEAAALQALIDKHGWSEALQQTNPFPSWVRDIVKHRLGSNVKATYDPENAVYKLVIEGDQDDADYVHALLREAYDKEKQKDDDRMKWSNDNHVHLSISTSPDSEHAMLADLASALGPGKEAGARGAQQEGGAE